MKKYLSALLALALMAVLLTGCCINHEWQDATCETPKTCAKCGETEGEALGHSWQDATCETAKTCTVCGTTEGEPAEHPMSWSPVVNDYTKMSGVCATCGITEEADMDWEVVAQDLVLGIWKDDTTTLEVLPDGTATMVMDGKTFQFNWNYLDLYEPYAGFNVLMVRYDFNLVGGGLNRAGIICMEYYEIGEITLQIGTTQITLAR